MRRGSAGPALSASPRGAPAGENQAVNRPASPPEVAAPAPAPAPTLVHSAFYRFTPLPDAVAAAAMLRTLAAELFGAITVAPEGLNGAVAGPLPALQAFEAALQRADVLDGAFAGMPFKHSACVTSPYARLKVLVKPEIVALGLPEATALPWPDAEDATHLSPQQWREMLRRQAGSDDNGPGVVLLDNRNHFEFRLGHFKGAEDPGVRHFRDFVAYVEAHAPAWREAQRPVAMYCTGGIRCDKTAPWLQSLGLQVLQLEGGILNYFQQMPDAAQDWQGECFVFDKRIALNAALQETPTTAEQVFDEADPGEAWRLARAKRLDAF